MSGSSFNYLYTKEPGEIMQSPINLEEMIEFLQESKKTAAATALTEYLDAIAECKQRLSAMHKNLELVMYATEWWVSGDWDESGFDAACAKALAKGGE